MERTKYDNGNPEKTIEWIFRNAMGNIVTLDATPTAQADMKANTMGYYNNKLYIRLPNGELKSFDLTHIA